MEKNKNHHGASGFFWGLIIGAILATLLTNKKGRKLLKEILDLGLEMLEEFIEEKSVQPAPRPVVVVDEAPIPTPNTTPREVEEVKEDLNSEVTANEEESSPGEEYVGSETPEPEIEVEEEISVESAEITSDSTPEEKPNGNGHSKKRLFRGIRRAK
ncbi:MAG TPA: hypothetical protein VHE53_01460 [Patescibacteria group bacterium]|nr:hypothetical protein [Patescibacteria group bacterium]